MIKQIYKKRYQQEVPGRSMTIFPAGIYKDTGMEPELHSPHGGLGLNDYFLLSGPTILN